MAPEVVKALRIERGGWFVDCTVGMGGHSRALLEANAKARVLGVDRDEKALSLACSALAPFGERFLGLHANFKDVDDWCSVLPEAPAGILADLGMSGYQLKAGRGFSFSDEDSLDMRMDPGEGEPVSAFLERVGEDELYGVLRTYGEEPFARRIARAVVAYRAVKPIRTSATLASIVKNAVPKNVRQRIHPATRTFQALRIFVNDELETLKVFLERAIEAMEHGGVIAVLAYHSLEDRIVKTTFRRLVKGCICPPKLPVCGCGREPSLRLVFHGAKKPSDREVIANPSSRSARLRAGEKL